MTVFFHMFSSVLFISIQSLYATYSDKLTASLINYK